MATPRSSQLPRLGAGSPLDSQVSRAAGPLAFLPATRAHVHALPRDGAGGPAPAGHGVAYRWSSRNNRKGRHALAVSPAVKAAPQHATPPSTTSVRGISRGVWRMFTAFPVYDVSYLVATTFTLGSVVWCVNAFFVFLPDVRPSTAFDTEVLYGGGITAFIGATIFEVGSLLLIVEAFNENRSECWGWAVEQVYEDHVKPHLLRSADEDVAAGGKGTASVRVDRVACCHHHANRRNLVGRGPAAASPPSPATSPASSDAAKGRPRRAWQWFPSAYDLRTHYLRNLGFLASLTQLFAASVFWIAGFTALPGVFDRLSPGLVDGVYWTPQVVGGLGFVVSSALLMLETQRAWYVPALGELGWHIGFWNLVGGLGFALSPAFGYDPAAWAQYQAGCSTFWGSWAFLIGSVIQWYEALDKSPVVVEDVG